MKHSGTYDLELDQVSETPWRLPGAGLRRPLLRGLAPPRYSAAEQLAAPEQPRTRLVKDVLRTGRWMAGVNDDGSPRWWIVTRPVLQQIEDCFDAARRAGNAFNLCWGHGDPHTRLVDSRDAIAPLDQVFLEGNTLWATVYVDAWTAADLRQAARQVSVRVVENWQDGAGRSYALALLHVAIVDLPVLTGQGPFLDLAHASPSLKGKVTMDFETQRRLWTRALAALGLTLPDDLTEETLPVVVDALLASLDEEQQPPDATGAAQAATLPPDRGASAAGSTDLGPLLSGIGEQIRDLSQRIDLMRTDDARSRFTSRLQDLAQAGRINARAVTSLAQTGAAHGWDLSLLAPFEDVQMIDLGRRGERLATGAPPLVSDVEPDLSQSEVDEGVAWLLRKR